MMNTTRFVLATCAASLTLACTGNSPDGIVSVPVDERGESSASKDDARETGAAPSTNGITEGREAIWSGEFLRLEMVFVGAAGMCTTDANDTVYPLCKEDALYAVEAGGVFIDKDERGKHRAQLTEEEFAGFLAIVNDEEFNAAMDEGRCPAAFEVAVKVGVEFTDSGALEDTSAAGCIGWRSNPHPYTKLRWLLTDFMQKYHKCPVVDAEPRLGDPVPSRLCNGCWAMDPPKCPEE